MTVESSGKVVSQTMKGMVHREAPVVVRSKLSEYLRCLKEGMYTPPGIYWNTFGSVGSILMCWLITLPPNDGCL